MPRHHLPGGPPLPRRTTPAPAPQAAKQHEAVLHALTRHASQLVRLAPAAADGGEGLPGPDAAPGAGVAAGAALAPAPRITEQQRALCSTTQLDGHLKAVGMAQFALMQGVHT